MALNAAIFIAFQGFRDEEFTEPKKALEAAGVKVTVVSTSMGLAAGKFRVRAQVDKTLDEVDPAAYDALVLAGGPGALAHLDNPKVHELLRTAEKLGKVLGAICISPVVLAHAGLLRGKKATVFPDGSGELGKAGAEVSAEDLVVDGKLVTANGPLPAARFGKALAELLRRA